jgi:hypothetical protein
MTEQTATQSEIHQLALLTEARPSSMMMVPKHPPDLPDGALVIGTRKGHILLFNAYPQSMHPEVQLYTQIHFNAVVVDQRDGYGHYLSGLRPSPRLLRRRIDGLRSFHQGKFNH